MKYKYWILWIIAIGSINISSCRNELIRANMNPNQPTKVSPGYLFNSSVFNTMNLFGGDMRREAFSNYSNYVFTGGGQFERYFYFEGTDNDWWQEAYVDCLQPLNQIIEKFGNDTVYSNRIIIAKIFECYIYSEMVAIWGSIPMSKAVSGTTSVPFDKEEDIYDSLLTRLKTEAGQIDLGGDKYDATSDPVYGGDLLNWKKFANTLRLELALRISNPAPNGNPDLAKAAVEDVLEDEDNTITSNDEDAQAQWGTTPQTWSYFYDYNVVNASKNANSLNVTGESLVQYMLPYHDPRLSVYAEPASEGPNKGSYWGAPKTDQLPQGISLTDNPHSGMAPIDYSLVGGYFSRPDAAYVFLSNTVSCFLKAEAALKGWGGSKTAEQYYDDGITASMHKYGIPQGEIDNYLNEPGIKWNTVVDTTGRQHEFADFLDITTSAVTHQDPFLQIVMQRYLGTFYNALDAWILIRRTQKLQFPPHFNPDGNEGGAKGYAYIPQRIVYPDIEYHTNAKELAIALPWLNGPDDMKTKLWFALPVIPNPYLH
jgi:hypothetical protein